MSDGPICTTNVFASGNAFHSWKCGKPGKFVTEGRHYCGQHDPTEQDRRRKARGPTTWEREMSAKEREIENLRRLAVAARNYRDQPGVKERQADLTAALLPYERVK